MFIKKKQEKLFNHMYCQKEALIVRKNLQRAIA